jgi:peptide/nickel transport system substrate-binding protein
MMFNEEFTPAFPNWMRAGGQSGGDKVEFSVVDDYTFKMIFTQPYGGLVMRLSVNGWRGYTDWLKPSHYLKQFHPKYATDADKAKWDALFDKYNLPKDGDHPWVNLMTQMNVNNWDSTHPKSIGFPTLNP